MRRRCVEEWPPLSFPRLLRHYFPPCSLERTRAGTTFAPNSPQSAFHVPCSGFFPGLDAGAFRLFRHALLVARRAERITQQTKERLLRRKTCFPPKPAPCSRPAPYPAPVSCSGSVSHSAPSALAARAQNEAPCQRRRPPSAAGKARMRGALGIEPESPPLPGKPDADPNRPLFSGVCLVRCNAQRTKPNP